MIVWATRQSTGVISPSPVNARSRLMAATTDACVGWGPAARSPATDVAALSHPSIATSLRTSLGAYRCIAARYSLSPGNVPGISIEASNGTCWTTK